MVSTNKVVGSGISFFFVVFLFFFREEKLGKNNSRGKNCRVEIFCLVLL